MEGVLRTEGKEKGEVFYQEGRGETFTEGIHPLRKGRGRRFLTRRGKRET